MCAAPSQGPTSPIVSAICWSSPTTSCWATAHPRMQPPPPDASAPLRMRDFRRSPWGRQHHVAGLPDQVRGRSETEGLVAPVELDDHVGASDRPKWHCCIKRSAYPDLVHLLA
jgi:hypothetical protein